MSIDNFKKHKYRMITHPKFLEMSFIKKLWKRFLCTKEIHMFDECLSLEHYLYCDACGLSVHIGFIESEYDACLRADDGIYIECKVLQKNEDNIQNDKAGIGDTCEYPGCGGILGFSSEYGVICPECGLCWN